MVEQAVGFCNNHPLAWQSQATRELWDHPSEASRSKEPRAGAADPGTGLCRVPGAVREKRPLIYPLCAHTQEPSRSHRVMPPAGKLQKGGEVAQLLSPSQQVWLALPGRWLSAWRR